MEQMRPDGFTNYDCKQADRYLSCSTETGLEGIDSVRFDNSLAQAHPSVYSVDNLL